MRVHTDPTRCGNDRDQWQCQGALLATGNFCPTHTENPSGSSSQPEQHTPIPGCLCSWCLTLQGMNFPNRPGSSSPVQTFHSQLWHLSHLQATESPFTFLIPCTSNSWTGVNYRLLMMRHPEEMPSTNLSDGPALQFKTKNFYLVMGH